MSSLSLIWTDLAHLVVEQPLWIALAAIVPLIFLFRSGPRAEK